MGFHFDFHSLDSTRDLRPLVDFIASQDLRYPRYDDWVQRTEHELEKGYKRAIMAFSSGKLVGDAIYQRHKAPELSSFLEIKNLRVDPTVRDRYIASFMLRQIEAENRNSYDAIIVDARPTELSIISFLESCGFRQIAKVPLYDKDVQEVTMTKFLKRSRSELLDSIAHKVIISRAL